MKCPIDGETLVIADRSGVEIDYCPKCRGVWLDRGELDKIIERAEPPRTAPQSGPWEPQGGRGRDDRRDQRRRPERRESFLSELFDFDF